MYVKNITPENASSSSYLACEFAKLGFFVDDNVINTFALKPEQPAPPERKRYLVGNRSNIKFHCLVGTFEHP
jgi:hypothetical protein